MTAMSSMTFSMGTLCVVGCRCGGGRDCGGGCEGRYPGGGGGMGPSPPPLP